MHNHPVKNCSAGKVIILLCLKYTYQNSDSLPQLVAFVLDNILYYENALLCSDEKSPIDLSHANLLARIYLWWQIHFID